jgi:hypothetical protein
MKKSFFLLVVFSVSIAISAQTKKGNMFLSGGTNLTVYFFNSSKPLNSGNSGEATKSNSISFMPSFGYFVANNLSIGLEGYLNYGVYKTGGAKYSSNELRLAPTISYFWPFNPMEGKLRLYSRFGVGISTGTLKGFTINPGSGISYFIKESISLNMDAGCNYKILTHNGDSNSKTFEQDYFNNIGISVFF